MLEWCPKQYSAGDIDGAGLRKLLGASHHDPLTLLVRETIQNSWDAHHRDDGSRVRADGPPSWTLELRTLDDAQRGQLRDAFERIDVPGTGLSESLERPTLRVMEISDRGTTGLGGPVRADLDFPLDTPTDFIDLVLNVGAPQDTPGGGGTYGFGKVAAFGMSRCSTVLYSTIPEVGTSAAPAQQPRLIGSTIGESFSMEGGRYTGRHWWGNRDNGSPMPLVGQQAAAAARRLLHHGFEEGETGTSLLVIDPNLEDDSPEAAIQRIVDAVLWNAWPKLTPRHGQAAPPMALEVKLDGERVDVPDPALTRPFAGFVDALRAVRALQDGRAPDDAQWTTNCLNVTTHEFASGNPIQLVGHAAVAICAPDDIPPLTREAEDHGTAQFRGPARHLALMREPELLVTYVEGTPSPNSRTEWCGVFKPIKELDHYFAAAEPPSHDDWLVGRVAERNGRIFVRRGREKGPRELFREMFNPRQADEESADTYSLAHVANRLGHLVGVGQGPAVTSGPRRSGHRQQHLRVIDSRPTTLPDGSPGVLVEFEVMQTGLLSVKPGVALAGGGADSGDDLADRLPEYLGLTSEVDSPAEIKGQPEGPIQPGTYVAWFRNSGRVTLAADITMSGA